MRSLFFHSDTPKLKRFMGRPKDISPKAFIKSLFGYALPFDRHDWIIDSNGTETRYVIDFYKGTVGKTVSRSNGSPPPAIAMHLDVRPAVDSPSTAFIRAKVFFMRLLGINPIKVIDQSIISSRPVEANKIHVPSKGVAAAATTTTNTTSAPDATKKPVN